MFGWVHYAFVFIEIKSQIFGINTQVWFKRATGWGMKWYIVLCGCNVVRYFWFSHTYSSSKVYGKRRWRNTNLWTYSSKRQQWTTYIITSLKMIPSESLFQALSWCSINYLSFNSMRIFFYLGLSSSTYFLLVVS